MATLFALRNPADTIRKVVTIAMVVVCVAAVTGGGAVEAQTETSLEILSVEHDPAGVLTVGLRANGARATRIDDLAVFVDGRPVPLEAGERQDIADLALLLAIDTSGSMQGEPIRAAREAARALIDLISADDRVGVVSFASAPAWQVGLTTDHALVSSVFDYLVPEGWTALYDTVELVSDELRLAPEERRVVLVLSDGRDDGGVSTVGRERSIERARESGTAVYAIGLGPDHDEQYLVELAAATGGEFHQMRDSRDVEALTALFEQLGARLAASETYRIPVPTMTLGEHEVSVRASVDGEQVQTTSTFQVTNPGLLSPTVGSVSADGEPFEVRPGVLTSSRDLTFEVRVGDVRFHESAPGVVSVDPWRLSPGQTVIELVALVDGRAAARKTLSVQVPRLDPVFSVEVGDDTVVARGRAQGTEAVLVAYERDREVARSDSGGLTIERSTAPLAVELATSSGTVLSRQEVPAVLAPVPAAAAPAGRGMPLWPLLLLPPVVGVGVMVWRRTRSRPLSVAARVLSPISEQSDSTSRVLRPVDPPASPAADTPAEEQTVRDMPLGFVMVVDPAGHRQAVPLTARPLTVGSSLACDIVLGDPVVRPQHLRLLALPRDEVRVHVLPERGSRPHMRSTAEEEQWLIAHHGEQIDIGSYSLQIVRGALPAVDAEASG